VKTLERIAAWFLKRRGFVCLSDSQFKVTLKVCEDSDKKLSRLVPRSIRGRRISGEPLPAEKARHAVSQLMWALRRAV
jgi:hypothetical protein